VPLLLLLLLLPAFISHCQVWLAKHLVAVANPAARMWLCLEEPTVPLLVLLLLLLLLLLPAFNL
jgi:hypothetical protein